MAKKESKHVKKFRELHAQCDENIVAWADGYIGKIMGKGDEAQHNGALIVTESRAVFYRKGILGEVLEAIPLKSVTSVDRKSMLGHRVIRLHAVHDDLEFKTFEKGGELALIEAIEKGREIDGDFIPKKSLDDDLEMLKKLADLRDSGALTEEEFSLKKEKLLSGI